MNEKSVTERSSTDPPSSSDTDGEIGRSRFLAAAGGTLFGLAAGLASGVEWAAAATKYPGEIDKTLTAGEQEGAILALENELGTNPSGGSTTLKERLDALGLGHGTEVPETGLFFRETEGQVDAVYLDGVQVLDASATPADGSVTNAKLAAEVLEAIEQANGQKATLAASLSAIKEQTALQKIPQLAVEISSSATVVYRIDWLLLFEAANATMDVQIGFEVPAACTLRWGGWPGNSANNEGWGSASTTSAPAEFLGAASVLKVGSRAGVIGVPVTAVALGGGTAGSVVPKYAQVTSDTGNLSVLKGSLVQARRISA